MKKMYMEPQAAVMKWEQREDIAAVTWNDAVSGEHNDTTI